ncbi:MAG: hypothetical protein ACRD2Z_11205 [Thermoanaerobaculia bacterium]
MKRYAMVPVVAALAVFAAGGRPAMGQQDDRHQADRWLHVRVTEQANGGATVELNLPIELVHKAVPLFEGASAEARLDFDEHGFDSRDLKELLRELTVSPDAEYVKIHDGGDEVRVVRAGRLMLVRVHEHGGSLAQVEARIPLRVVEALASGEGDSLNIRAALDALAQEQDGELVTIVDDDGATHVRMWIDSSNEQRPEA